MQDYITTPGTSGWGPVADGDIYAKNLEKQNSENLSSDRERKKFNFKGKKKFKSRNSRPKNFTFKKHNKKRRKF